MGTKRQFRYLLVEDEPPAATRFQKLMKLCHSFVPHGAATSGSQAIGLLKENNVDVVFLDIELSDMSGFDLLDRIPADNRPLIVFVTAYDKYALMAFDYFAIDYLLKPFSNERFHKMISRVEAQLSNNEQNSWTGLTEAIRTGNLPGTIVVRTGKKHHFISIADIAWVSADGNYCDIHLENGEVHIHRETISKLTEILPNSEFARIHQSYVIRTSFVKSVNRILFSEMEVVLKDSTVLKVSRSYKNVVRSLMQNK